jgi:molybdopterin-guanine dinucleotide biosynthesis protein B
MIPIVAVVGESDSGKTTLIEKLIPELKSRGYRVASIKHNAHGFEIDREGKDSYRHRRAGAVTTILSSPDQYAVVADAEREYKPKDLCELFVRDADIVVCEGFKQESLPRIMVLRDQAEELTPEAGEGLIAVASDHPVDAGAPCYPTGDIKGLADLIEDKFLKNEFFVQEILGKAILAMIGTLRGCESPRQVEIRIHTAGKEIE